MISRDALKRTLKLANEGEEMRDLVISLSGGYGGTKRKVAIDDLSHILRELEKTLEGENNSP